jgi:hypothetical protein
MWPQIAVSRGADLSTDIADVLAKAWKAVQDAKIPEPLQELALGRAIDLLTGSYVPPQGAEPPKQNVQQPEQGADTGSGSAGSVDEKELYRRMSEGTGVTVEMLERLVHLDDGVPKILLKKAQLGTQAARAQKAITLILTVATHYLTGDDEVDLGPMREECKQLNLFDANFMANVGGIPDITITGPRGGNKKVKVRKALLHSFKDELTKYGLISE